MFELREALIRQIVFAMENQRERYLIEADAGRLIPEAHVDCHQRPHDEVIDPEARYQRLPEWNSTEGFHLMEAFVAQFHNHVVGDRLQEILLQGERVFRRFKDELKRNPSVERRVFRL